MTRPTVLAYYFPDWHKDPRNAAWFGDGWDEWHLLRAAQPRYPGHRQPRVPALGWRDESDPSIAAHEIDLAADHGIDGFLVDYYWYDDGSYLSGALDNGLLGAPNRERIRFALMWANHELVDIFPSDDPHGPVAPRLKDGAIDRVAFESMARHVIDTYFTLPNYLTVDGRPWFSVYEIGNLIAGLGGVKEARDALRWFEEETISAGFPGLHLDAVVWGFGVLPTAVSVADPASLVHELGFRSATSYVWVHHTDATDHPFPAGDPEQLRDEAFAAYEEYAASLSVPFHPNITVGWDASPRTRQDIAFEAGRYPYTPVWDQTPEQFESALEMAKEFVLRHPTPWPAVTINAWNEWTEGSALLPDSHHGTAYLDAVKRVFGDAGALDGSAASAELAGQSTATTGGSTT
jgi:hypothetical protein